MSRWKQANWDKWTFWKKVRHVLAVIASLISVVIMFLVTCWVVLIIFGVQGFIMKFKETLIMEIVNLLKGL